MGKLVRYCLLALLAFGTVSVAEAANTKFTNLEVTGTLTADGAVNAASTAVKNSTMGVTVSSATTSTASLCIGGAFASLPTTGFNQGCLVYDTADQKLYISTQTVVGTFSWKSVGSQ